jgi:hypothetical protein
MTFTVDSGCGVDMTGRKTLEVAAKMLVGVGAALSITCVAFFLRFNLSSATSLHLLLVTIIALRWGFLEASVVSLVSVACLDYFFTEPLFKLYMSDPHDWVALVTFESVALIVSRLSNRVSRHARESEAHGASLQKLYELSQSILLLDRQKPIEQQLASLISDTFHVQCVALWNAYDLRLSMPGICESVKMRSAAPTLPSAMKMMRSPIPLAECCAAGRGPSARWSSAVTRWMRHQSTQRLRCPRLPLNEPVLFPLRAPRKPHDKVNSYDRRCWTGLPMLSKPRDANRQSRQGRPESET